MSSETLEAMGCALREAGGELDTEGPHIILSGYDVLGAREVEGLTLTAEPTPRGITATITVKEGVRLVRPLRLCIGLLGDTGEQDIKINVSIGRGARAEFVAHCVFPSARKARHAMKARVMVGEEAELSYSEIHYHGPYGGMLVVPVAEVTVKKGGRYSADFSLLKGSVGRLEIDYKARALEDSVVEFTARVFGRANDLIEIKEKISLDGKNARGLIKTRVALMEDASADVIGITEGNAEGARGHVDCIEVVRDRAVASAVPVVKVTNPLSKVTHEAAIGSVDRNQLQTLMARGLAPEEAVEMIVKGILS